MEYYESIHSDRHLIFLSKTQALLTKSNVVHAMNNSVDTKKTLVVIITRFHSKVIYMYYYAQNQMQGDKDKRLEDFFKKAKENKGNFDEYAGSILKSHETGQNSVYMLILNSLNAQRALMKRKLERRKKAHYHRVNSNQPTTERDANARKRRSIYKSSS